MKTLIYFEKSGIKSVSETNPLPVTILPGSSEFSENVNTNNATTPVRLVNGETGKSIEVTSLFVSSQTATQVTLQDGDGTAVLGPIYIAANTPHSSSVQIPVASGKDLNFKTSTATNVTVFVSGVKI